MTSAPTSSLSVSQAFTVNASGDFVAPAGTASFSGRFRVLAASTFDANGGTVVFDGTANSSVACGGKAFALVSFEQTSGVKSVEGDCSLPLGANPTLGDGSEAGVKLSGTLSGTGTLAVDQNLTMNRTGQLTGFGGLDVDGNLTVTSATANFGSYAPFSVDGAFSQAAGKVTVPSGADFGGSFALNPRAIFEAPAGAVAIGADFSVNPEATFYANGGTVVFDGSQSATLSCGSAKFNSVAFSHVAGTKTVGPSCSLPLGSSPTAGSGSIALEGALSGSGALTTGGTLSLREGGSLAGFSGLAAQGVAVEGSYDFGAYSSFSVAKGFASVPPATSQRRKGPPLSPATSPTKAAFDGGNGGAGRHAQQGSGQSVSGDTTFNNLTKIGGCLRHARLRDRPDPDGPGLAQAAGQSARQPAETGAGGPGSPWKIDRSRTGEVEFVSVAESTNVGSPITAAESVSEGGNTGCDIFRAGGLSSSSKLRPPRPTARPAKPTT